MDQDFAKTSALYLRFAEDEVRGRSPLYEHLARDIAADHETIEFLLTLPKQKRQPNLLLAAVRHLFGTPTDWHRMRQMIIEHREELRALMMERSTQTNEPARCATLLPLLMRLPQPLALIEVGASGGLCLLPDLYAYDFGKGIVKPTSSNREPPLFSCAVNDATQVPMELPRIVWRAGLDLNPLDVANPAHSAWLETLVWPEQTDRVARLRTQSRSPRPRGLAS